ncbi:hypothetical protein KQI68_07250 [Peptoniphilus sp. MSJ-1]|uniref:Uncharacterized protein n=1 Tax=Peptoniphilus ovalis TaxID=2841503 RepID=A0ABS6FHI5_9FIRM|nr:hypothetical protein [Peptoniphilus ovalis]MBU5669635.1 hypothetical protein [Peptoniphilus ovalis]
METKTIIDKINEYLNENYTIMRISNILHQITGDDLCDYDWEDNIFNNNNIALNIRDTETWILVEFDVIQIKEPALNSIVRITEVSEM